MINPFNKYGQTEDENRILEGFGLLFFVGIVIILLLVASSTDITSEISDAFRAEGQRNYDIK